MPNPKTTNDTFTKKYKSYENENTEDFLKRYSSTEAELKATIEYLIIHRQLMRDVEIERLEAESETLLRKIKEIDVEKMIEEIKCFKEILALQKKLLEKNDKPRDRW